jgi:hypothetical protein
MNRRFLLLSLGLVSGLALLNFHRVLSNDYSLDDSYYLSQVEQVLQWKDLWSVTGMVFSEVDYRPVSSLSFGIEKLIVGEMRPGFSHFINLLLYIGAAFVFLCLVLRLPFNFRKQETALLTGLLFTILPLHCSMVANVKNRDGLLSFIFGMLFLHAMFSLFTAKGGVIKRILFAALAGAAILLSIYSKIDAFSFIMLVPAVALLFYRDIQWKSLARIGLITVVTYRIFIALFYQWTAQVKAVIPEESIGDPLMFSENPIVEYDDMATQVAFAVQTVFEYLLMIFKPTGHYFYYGYDMIPVLGISSPIIWIKAGILLLLLLTAAYMYLKAPVLSSGIGIFFIGLIYCSNLITPVAGIVADRYAFIASAGACLAMATGILLLSDYLWQKFPALRFKTAGKVIANKGKNTKPNKTNASAIRIQPHYIAYGIIALLTMVYLPFNVLRAAEWSDIFTLTDADLKKIGNQSYEANRIAVKNYVETAFELEDEVQRSTYFKKALVYAQQAIKIYDGHLLLQEGIVMSYYGLNNIEMATREARSVIQRFDTSEVSWRILSEYYYASGQIDSAAMGFYRLTQLVPESPEVWLYYVTTLQETGRYNEALAFTDSIPTDRGLPPYLPHHARTYLYLNYNDSARAVIEIEQAFEKGWRDMKMLDVAGQYWWTRDMKKWEDLKKYLN